MPLILELGAKSSVHRVRKGDAYQTTVSILAEKEGPACEWGARPDLVEEADS
jgi:hypothetical protein